MVYSSIRMGLYDPLKALLPGDTNGEIGLLNKIMAGGLSGAIGSYIANPCDIIKVVDGLENILNNVD